MAAKKNHDLHFHHPDHVLIALGCIIAIAVFIGYSMGRSVQAPRVSGPLAPTPEINVACTMDAMTCPDGTTVGRSGPNCEFVCP